MAALQDIKGHRFGRWTVIGPIVRIEYRAIVSCRCDCGSVKDVYVTNLRRGLSKSCGCLRVTHGLKRSTEYGIWAAMLYRATNPKCSHWPNYGGRGVTVCERWRKFENFYADMGDRPDGATLDRINNDGPYSPDNCRWATTQEQANNRRTSTQVQWRGETKTIAEWSRVVGISQNLLRTRLYRGDTPPRLFRPVQSKGRASSP